VKRSGAGDGVLFPRFLHLENVGPGIVWRFELALCGAGQSNPPLKELLPFAFDAELSALPSNCEALPL